MAAFVEVRPRGARGRTDARTRLSDASLLPFSAPSFAAKPQSAREGRQKRGVDRSSVRASTPRHLLSACRRGHTARRQRRAALRFASPRPPALLFALLFARSPRSLALWRCSSRWTTRARSARSKRRPSARLRPRRVARSGSRARGSTRASRRAATRSRRSARTCAPRSAPRSARVVARAAARGASARHTRSCSKTTSRREARGC